MLKINGLIMGLDNNKTSSVPLEGIPLEAPDKIAGKNACTNGGNINGSAVCTNYDKSSNYSFSHSSIIESLTIPSSCKRIGLYAFFDLEKLRNVYMEEGCEIIGENAFTKCICLENVRIPCSVREMGNCVFGMCKNLTSITFEEGIEEIGDELFKDCENLQEIMLPKSFKKIGQDIFLRCKNLKKVIITNELEVKDHHLFSFFQMIFQKILLLKNISTYWYILTENVLNFLIWNF